MVFIRAKCGFLSHEIGFTTFLIHPDMVKFRSNLVQFWQKWAIFEISQKKTKMQFIDSRDNASSKTLGNSDARLSKKSKNPPFLLFLAILGLSTYLEF